MGVVEHLKTLCRLGLKPESAMIAVTPLLHEIIPHGWSRIRTAPDATCTRGYGEHPETGVIFRKRLWTFAKDPPSPALLGRGCDKKLYQTLDVHNSAELCAKIWLDRKQADTRQSLRRAG